MASPRVAGICYIKVDGEQLELKGSMEAPLMATKNETVMASAGVAGRKETPVAPYIKGKFVFTKNFPAKKLEGDNLTITAEFANGKVYTISQGYVVGDVPVNGEEGEVDLEFNGKKGIWQ